MLCQNIGIWTLIFFLVIQLLDLSHLSSPAHQNILMRVKKTWCAQDEMVVLSNLNSLTQSVHSHTRCLARLPLGRLLPLVGWPDSFFVPLGSTCLDSNNNNHPGRAAGRDDRRAEAGGRRQERLGEPALAM